MVEPGPATAPDHAESQQVAHEDRSAGRAAPAPPIPRPPGQAGRWSRCVWIRFVATSMAGSAGGVGLSFDVGSAGFARDRRTFDRHLADRRKMAKPAGLDGNPGRDPEGAQDRSPCGRRTASASAGPRSALPVNSIRRTCGRRDVRTGGQEGSPGRRSRERRRLRSLSSKLVVQPRPLGSGRGSKPDLEPVGIDLGEDNVDLRVDPRVAGLVE